LDGEGRCVCTDHGAFVVFNVYVPNAGNGSRLPYKQRWLRGKS
jgi:exonuclease III